MASRQEKGEERAEEAAASELSDTNRRERGEREDEGGPKMESRDRDYYDQGEQERPGVIGTILKSVAETLESAKEAVVGKSYDEPREGGYEEEERGVTEKAEETKEAGKEKAETAKEKAEETKERARETKDSAVGKLSETAKRAMEKLTGGGRREGESEEEPKEKYMETEDEARRKMQELKLREEGYDDEDRKRAEAERETAEDRGAAGTRNIFSAIGSAKEAIKEKLTMPSDVVEETQAAREHGSTKRATTEKKVVDAEGNPVEEAGRVQLHRVERRE